MKFTKDRMWLNAVLVAAAIVLPFGTFVVLAVLAARKRAAREAAASVPREEWMRLRHLATRGSDGSRLPVPPQEFAWTRFK